MNKSNKIKQDMIDHLALRLHTHPDIVRGSLLLDPNFAHQLDNTHKSLMEDYHKVFVKHVVRLTNTKLAKPNKALQALSANKLNKG